MIGGALTSDVNNLTAPSQYKCKNTFVSHVCKYSIDFLNQVSIVVPVHNSINHRCIHFSLCNPSLSSSYVFIFSSLPDLCLCSCLVNIPITEVCVWPLRPMEDIVICLPPWHSAPINQRSSPSSSPKRRRLSRLCTCVQCARACGEPEWDWGVMRRKKELLYIYFFF